MSCMHLTSALPSHAPLPPCNMQAAVCQSHAAKPIHAGGQMSCMRLTSTPPSSPSLLQLFVVHCVYAVTPAVPAGSVGIMISSMALCMHVHMYQHGVCPACIRSTLPEWQAPPPRPVVCGPAQCALPADWSRHVGLIGIACEASQVHACAPWRCRRAAPSSALCCAALGSSRRLQPGTMFSSAATLPRQGENCCSAAAHNVCMRPRPWLHWRRSCMYLTIIRPH